MSDISKAVFKAGNTTQSITCSPSRMKKEILAVVVRPQRFVYRPKPLSNAFVCATASKCGSGARRYAEDGRGMDPASSGIRNRPPLQEPASKVKLGFAAMAAE